MTKRLYIYALITSPFLGAYGVSPVYIFDKIQIGNFFFTAFGLSMMTFFHWIVIITILTQTEKQSPWVRNALAVLGTLCLEAVGFYTRINLPSGELIRDFFLYPALFGILITAIILIICNSVLIDQKKKDAEVEIERLRAEKLEAQKQVLMQQLQPHFLFNSLSVLKSLISSDDTEAAENYAVKLSDFLRYSVESHHTTIVSLKDELRFTKDYIDLQKVRFDTSFRYHVDIPDELLQKNLPVYALQTLVENAFKHNYFTEKNPLTIQIMAIGESIIVKNNKVSINIKDKPTSTGLNNLNSRYELITGKSIDVNDTPEHFNVTMPLI